MANKPERSKILLVWLDSEISSTNELSKIEKRLHEMNQNNKLFLNLEQCENYIKTIDEHSSITVIINILQCQNCLRRIIELEQVFSIYVYSFTVNMNNQCIHVSDKVRGTFTQLDSLFNTINFNHIRRIEKMKESLPISVYGRSTGSIDSEFMYLQLLIAVLFQMYQGIDSKAELVSYCKNICRGNKQDLSVVKEFEKSYLPWNAIWWYTRETFLYKIVNRALRLHDIETIFLFRFFIRDVHDQLKSLSCIAHVRSYRGQSMSDEEIKTLEASVGKLIAVNSFFSTSLNRQSALAFAKSLGINQKAVLFEIDADPNRSKRKPFASIETVSYYPGEKEVLFMIGSIFRLCTIESSSRDLIIIRLQLCSDDDNELKEIFKCIKGQIGGYDGILSVGNILVEMGNFELAEKYYDRGIKELQPNDSRYAHYYHGLGLTSKGKGDYDLSLKRFQASLECYKKIGNQYSIANIYNNMAVVYAEKGDYRNARQSHNMALSIYQLHSDEYCQDIAMCYNNLGAVYFQEKDYNNALEFYQQAYAIWYKILPQYHPLLGGSYDNIGTVQLHLKHYRVALECFNNSLIIKEKILRSPHADIGKVHQSIGLAHERYQNLTQALLHYRKAEIIFRTCVPNNSKRLLEVEDQIRSVTSLINKSNNA